MNRNQKIALGCGGVGCLGLVVLAVVGVAGYTFYWKTGTTNLNRNRNTNFNFNTNTNSNSNSSSEANANADEEDSSSSMSEDEKHKLFQAASGTQDSQAMLRVMRKFGFLGQTTKYQKFAQEHMAWGLKNLEFIQSINTPEKARAYFDAHIDD